MKIFVTGGCGFIGSNFIHRQIDNTNNIILNIDSLTYAGNIENLSNLSSNERYIFKNGNICDTDFVDGIMSNFKPDAVVHFAAESHVDKSIDDPLKFVNTNIVGTANLLDISLKYWRNSRNSDDNFRFLHVSTDEVFGSLGEKGFFNETTPYAPSSPYSASKASSDHLVRSWKNTYDFPILITNCSNNYGPYQFPEKIIPLMIANGIDEKPLPIYGDGSNIRDWLFVGDHCDAIYSVLKNGKIGDTYAIGGNCEIKNIDLVNKICLILDKLYPRANGKSYNELITFVNDRPGHDFRYSIDFSKIKNDLGWTPKETFDSGIFKTIQWYLKNERWWRKIQEKSNIKKD